MPAGRPTDYTPELAVEICSRLATGESLRSICRDDHMPNKTTVFKWLFENKFPEFNDQYAQARAMQAETMAEEMLDIADDGTNDWMERFDSEGNATGYQLNGEHVQRSKLRIDTRKWAASKLLPKRYGDRITTEHTGKVSFETQFLESIKPTAGPPSERDSEDS